MLIHWFSESLRLLILIALWWTILVGCLHRIVMVMTTMKMLMIMITISNPTTAPMMIIAHGTADASKFSFSSR